MHTRLRPPATDAAPTFAPGSARLRTELRFRNGSTRLPAKVRVPRRFVPQFSPSLLRRELGLELATDVVVERRRSAVTERNEHGP